MVTISGLWRFCPSHSWQAGAPAHLEDLPPMAVLAARTREVADRIARQRTAAVGEEFTGPVLIEGQASGEFAAVDAKSGAHLWHFETQETWKASPMTYSVNGKQYVAITSGANVLAFALP